MALGQVTLDNLNLGQGAVTAIERYFLFIGPAAKNVGRLLSLDKNSDLDALLGIPPSDLKTQVETARLNGGQQWQCMAAPIGNDDTWAEMLEKTQERGMTFEAVVITKPVQASAELTAMHEAIELINSKHGRRMFVIAASLGCSHTETWADYLAGQVALVKDVLAPRVMVVPQLHGRDLGALAGRLANAAVSVADSPMRVATGPVLGLGIQPNDSEGALLPSAVLSALDKARLSVSQTYSDYPGMYWGDGNMLDAPASDFQVVEYLRITDKAARLIRPLLIQRVADRRLNSTANSMAVNTTRLMAPLRAMAKSAKFNGEVFPGDIMPPKDGDLVLVWMSKTSIQAFFKLTPLNNPKELKASIALDLSTGDQE